MDILGRITQLREARGWSVYRLAKEAGISQSTITNLYKRENSPTVSTLEAICHAFGLSLGQFFGELDENQQLTPDQRELLNNWARLPNRHREKVMGYILGLLEQ